jgi:two-component system, NtrC family, sensor kinase
MRVWDLSHLDNAVATAPTKREVIYDFADSQANINRIRQHFNQLKKKLIFGLLLGFLLPGVLLSAYFHYQFSHTLKKSAMLNLAAVAESQKNTIDLYLQERVANIYSLLRDETFSYDPGLGRMDAYLRHLQQFSDGFTDIGMYDKEGVLVGYAGPHHHLVGKTFSSFSWYSQLLGESRNYVASDIHTGFGTHPHFTIATRQVVDGNTVVISASLDPDKVFMFLRSISQGKEVESTLINRQGQYQVVDPGHGRYPDASNFVPPVDSASGVEEIHSEEKPLLIAFAWLKETPWALLASQPVSVAQAGMYQARIVLTVSTIVIGAAISIIIYMTITNLVANAQTMAEKGQQLQDMLAHASNLASIGELAASVAHEINNPLAIIMATSGVIRDMFNPEFELDHSRDALCKELEIIDNAALRAKGITRKLQDMGKSRVPCSVSCDINQLLGEVIDRLKKVEFKGKHLKLHTALAENLPPILAEPDPLKQVFGNILINAADAIVDSGSITIGSAVKEDAVHVTISDTGHGISAENLERIFHPFFTTKGGGKGVGLGLSIAASIVKYLGGTIKANSIPGTGSSFTIILPIPTPGSKKKSAK